MSGVLLVRGELLFLKQTSCAKAFRRIGEDLRFASSTNSMGCLQFDASILDGFWMLL